MIISYSNLSFIRDRHPGEKIIFTSGSFDLIHPGHLLILEACKALGDLLVVAVGTDAEIRRDKREPLYHERARVKMVDAFKCVDYALLNAPHSVDLGPLDPVREMCTYLKPDIWAVNHDASRMDERRTLAQELGIELKVLNLDRNDPEWWFSTTEIIRKIKEVF